MKICAERFVRERSRLPANPRENKNTHGGGCATAEEGKQAGMSGSKNSAAGRAAVATGQPRGDNNNQPPAEAKAALEAPNTAKEAMNDGNKQ